MSRSEKDAKAVRIVDFKSNQKVVLNELAVKKIIQEGGIEDMPTVIVSIGGVARSGKSFLLNLFVNYLLYLEKNGTDTGWETCNAVIQGIQWARSQTAVTLGIWMWNRPFIIRRENGFKVAVLLVDTQGTGDNKRSDAKLDTLIMYISLQLSSFQLINIQSYVASTELTSLELCTDYAEIGSSDDSSKGETVSSYLFQSLILIVRNCQDRDQFGEDSKLFSDIKTTCENEKLKKAVVGIEKAFRSITSFTFPHPGNQIARASEDQKVWTLRDIPPDFLEPVKELCNAVFSSDRLSTEELHSGAQHIDMIKLLKFRLESTELPEIGTPADALQDAVLYRAYSKTHLLYTGSLAEIKKNLLSQKTEDELRKAVVVVQNLALHLFHTEGHQEKYGGSPIWGKYEERFTSVFNDDLSNLIVLYAQQMKMVKLEKQSEEVKRKMEEQARESARNIGKLEEESKQTQIKLNEAAKRSEEREEAHKKSLHELEEKFKTAKEEDRIKYEQQAQRNRDSITREQQERAKSEKIHNDTLARLRESEEQMRKDAEQKKKEIEEEMNELKRDLEKERNKPPPPRKRKRGFFYRVGKVIGF